MTILWDWNGTLINDRVLTLDIENELFVRRGYPLVTMETYLDHFTFPVVNYYKWLGVSEEDFAEMNDLWLNAYRSRCGQCGLHPAALEAARRLHANGHRQVIISASEQELLRRQVAGYPELDGVFDQVLGLRDSLARSKVQRALEFLEEDGVDPAEAVFLGDTCHDAETAHAIGCRCVLICGGHQSQKVLETAGVPVAEDAMAAIRLLGLEA